MAGGHWQSIGSGQIVRLPVINSHGATDAERVYASLRFTGPEGFELEQPGRWRDDPESPEVTISGNGRPYELDLFVSLPSAFTGEKCYVWNQESLLAGVHHDDFRIEPEEFMIKVVVRGKRAGAVSAKTWRVLGLSSPQLVPEGEKFTRETAASGGLDFKN